MLRIKNVHSNPRIAHTFGKVTIIITNYNKNKFLKKAIESCFNQSYKDIEVIVIDDCSKDTSILNEIVALKNKNIRVFSNSNNYGHYACCNFGIDKASGKYVTFLGADDSIEKDHIKNLVYNLNKFNLKAICCTYGRFDESGNRVGPGGRLCEASITFDRKLFLEKVGYFHMVRFAADTEYRMRAEKIFGQSSLGVIPVDSYRALQLNNSLMTSKKTKPGSPSRRSYAIQFINRIKKGQSQDLFFNHKNSDMSFLKLDDVILVKNFNLNTFKEIKG